MREYDIIIQRRGAGMVRKSILISEELWREAEGLARCEERSFNWVVKKALEAYVDGRADREE